MTFIGSHNFYVPKFYISNLFFPCCIFIVNLVLIWTTSNVKTKKYYYVYETIIQGSNRHISSCNFRISLWIRNVTLPSLGMSLNKSDLLQKTFVNTTIAFEIICAITPEHNINYLTRANRNRKFLYTCII